MKQLLHCYALFVATIILLASCSKNHDKKSSYHDHKKETVEENIKPVIINEKANQNNVEELKVDKNEYTCYWMENISGKFEWVIADIIYEEKVSKEYCFNLDSCSGGRGESGGGCYKWAKSANDKQQPW